MQSMSLLHFDRTFIWLTRREFNTPEIMKCNKVIIQIFVHLPDGFPCKNL